jgi:hypothetical protein
MFIFVRINHISYLRGNKILPFKDVTLQVQSEEHKAVQRNCTDGFLSQRLCVICITGV